MQTLALAVFGFTGISYGEIMAYTYWCLEKGYSQHNNESQEVKAWIKVMQTDVWATVFFVTIGTVPFFLLGAAVLNTLGLYPPPGWRHHSNSFKYVHNYLGHLG